MTDEDIPPGGEKTNGFGRTEVEISKQTWLTGKDAEGVTHKLFGKQALNQKGIWQALELEGGSAADALQPL